MPIKNIVLDGTSLNFNTIAEVAYGDGELIKVSIPSTNGKNASEAAIILLLSSKL